MAAGCILEMRPAVLLLYLCRGGSASSCNGGLLLGLDRDLSDVDRHGHAADRKTRAVGVLR